MNMKKLVVICIACLCIAAMPAIAQENNTSTNGNETNVTATPTPTTEPTVAPTTEPTVTETATPVPTEAKFRVGPTVTLRPVNDVIDKSQDGLVELYMNNPTLNDVTLTADVQIAVPSGIHVYGEGFGYGAAAGTVAGTFTVPPGTVRTIHINIKADKVGDFTVHFTGLYWPDDDKDAFQQISLTHPLTVKEPSPKPMNPEPTGGAGETGETSTDKPNEQPLPSGLLSVIAIVVAFGALMIRKN
jgi:hypothetical protein|uniref:Uncharacterized protein n=1 Tax=Candidatus Methanogaster sp. ANME-2c ERB4 TaxID=2759911 RepID=A0A7G9YNH3_9EURY|nr:hypothetical protein HIGBABBE_00030 [Methanosarcinales archaeon ANME-2c ERB4]